MRVVVPCIHHRHFQPPTTNDSPRQPIPATARPGPRTRTAATPATNASQLCHHSREYVTTKHGPNPPRTRFAFSSPIYSYDVSCGSCSRGLEREGVVVIKLFLCLENKGEEEAIFVKLICRQRARSRMGFGGGIEESDEVKT